MNSAVDKFDIEPANPEHGVMNCIVIPADMLPCVGDIFQEATNHDAFLDQSHTKSGGAKCCVRYPGRKQELLNYDEIMARNREIMKIRERVRTTTVE